MRRQRPTDGDAQLASIAAVARESVTAMSDIVWAISPDRDGLLDLTRKMREHAEEVFAAGDTRLTFTAPDITRNVRLSVDARRDIYLIFKEAINNAARHASGSRVDVELQFEGTQLILTVADDGAGFDPAVDADGNGLESMSRRARRLGARFDVRSRPGEERPCGWKCPSTACTKYPVGARGSGLGCSDSRPASLGRVTRPVGRRSV